MNATKTRTRTHRQTARHSFLFFFLTKPSQLAPRQSSLQLSSGGNALLGCLAHPSPGPPIGRLVAPEYCCQTRSNQSRHFPRDSNAMLTLHHAAVRSSTSSPGSPDECVHSNMCSTSILLKYHAVFHRHAAKINCNLCPSTAGTDVERFIFFLLLCVFFPSCGKNITLRCYLQVYEEEICLNLFSAEARKELEDGSDSKK